MQTIADLRAKADALMLAGAPAEALQAYRSLLALQPTQVDVRLRIGDALMQLGAVRQAANVYGQVARYAAHAGYPFRALVAAELLRLLDPSLAILHEQIAQLYAAESPRLGVSARASLGDPDERLPKGFVLTSAPTTPTLIEAASHEGASLLGLEDCFPDRLPALPLFSRLTPSVLAAMFDQLQLVRTRPGEVIVQQGGPGDSFFVLARGAVRITQHSATGERELARLYAGAIFGEMALVRATPRHATVTSIEDCDLLRFDASALHAAQEEMQAVARTLDHFARERALENLLCTAPLFRPLNDEQRRSLLRRFVAYDVGPGSEILSEHQPGPGLFILWNGQAEVSKLDGAERLLIATLGEGDVFGEISILEDRLVTATVTATTDCRLLFLAREYFVKLVAAFPDIRSYVEGLKDQRLLDSHLQLEDTYVSDPGPG